MTKNTTRIKDLHEIFTAEKSRADNIRLVQERKGDRRKQQQSEFKGKCQRKEIRRLSDKEKLEQQKALVEEYKKENERLRQKNAEFIISKREYVFHYASMGFSIFIITVWGFIALG